jgi:peptide/nickel transport system ATP-binding protein
MRIDGLCNRLPPPRHALDKGNEVLCHHRQDALLRLRQELAA